MDDVSSSVMIALLPREANLFTVDLPHMTLVYAGLISDLWASARNELGKDTAALAAMNSPITLKPRGIENFGDADEKVNVLTLDNTMRLQGMRDIVERWNESEWPFNPHVTIGPVGTVIDIPMTLTFDRIVLAWGDEHVVFPFAKTEHELG